MTHEFSSYFAVVSVLGSVAAAYLSYYVYKYNILRKEWLAITLAFVLVIFRRALGYIGDLSINHELHLLEDVLLVTISALYIWGFWGMKKSFEAIKKS